MEVKPNPMTVGDYAEAVSGKRIIVNRDYQRGGDLWPYRARSALIETIILGYPMPAIFLHQTFDSDTRKPKRDIVDGQQRTDAIREFWENNHTLSTTLATERLRGKKLKSLEEGDYERFVTYSLPVFIFTEATPRDVQEAFRRINSHTSVLNPEEMRHSRYQGAMKWFVVDLSSDLQEQLKILGVFTKNQLLRMNDAKFVSEILYAILYGVTTTKSQQLDTLYEDYDDESSLENPDEIKRQVTSAMDVVATWDWLPSYSFNKSYHFLCLVLAIMHAQRPVPKLAALDPGGRGLRPEAEIASRMALLERALESAAEIKAHFETASGETAGDLHSDDGAEDASEEAPTIDSRLLRYRSFVEASGTRTNTEETRTVRFRTFLQAISN